MINTSPTKVMFVCMGNICRSPLAHAVFQQRVNDAGLEDHFFVESSGTISYHEGEQADPRMRATAKRHGITIDHPARHLKPRDLDEFDFIFAMDKENLKNIRALATTGDHLEKIKLFREYDPDTTDGDEVPDPYYGGDQGFENVFQMVDRTCDHLLNALKK